jgi:hypothetical protein
MKPGTRHILGKGFDEKAMTITARYEDGVFKPLENVTINEGTIVEVHVPSYADRLKAKSCSGFCLLRHVEGSH